MCQAIRKNVEEFWKNPVGTGPFRFDSWDIERVAKRLHLFVSTSAFQLVSTSAWFD